MKPCMKHFSAHRPCIVLLALLRAVVLQAETNVGAATDATTEALPVTQRSWSVGIGPSKVQDTYLSAVHFSGTGFTLLGSYVYERPGRRWYTAWQHQLHASQGADRAGHDSMLEGAYDLYLGRLRCWPLAGNKLSLAAGVMANIGIGGLYNTRNGNNPAQARLHLALMPTLAARYRFSLCRTDMTLGYEAQLPLAGVMFSPRFGQSYYEIFGRGNYDRNMVVTTFVSAPTFRQQLTLDGQIGRRATIRIGLLADLQQARVNDIRQHVYSYRLMLGLTHRFSVVRRM